MPAFAFNCWAQRNLQKRVCRELKVSWSQKLLLPDCAYARSPRTCIRLYPALGQALYLDLPTLPGANLLVNLIVRVSFSLVYFCSFVFLDVFSLLTFEPGDPGAFYLRWLEVHPLFSRPEASRNLMFGALRPDLKVLFAIFRPTSRRIGTNLPPVDSFHKFPPAATLGDFGWWWM